MISLSASNQDFRATETGAEKERKLTFRHSHVELKLKAQYRAYT